jgi:hypothetical protein
MRSLRKLSDKPVSSVMRGSTRDVKGEGEADSDTASGLGVFCWLLPLELVTINTATITNKSYRKPMFLLTIISFCLKAYLKRQSVKSNKGRLSRPCSEVYLVNVGIKFEDNKKLLRMSPIGRTGCIERLGALVPLRETPSVF